MFFPHIATAVLSLTSVALAFVMPKVDVTLEHKHNATNTTCWVGNIHGVCHGHENGCTPDGIYVTCQASNYSGQMIYNNICSPPGSPHGTLPGTCHCINGTGESSC
ncbi:hypothetical protein VP1G_03968 [Cytospora mali]|uniref:Uncharacterized protein n=1 Tax=Cytospora mali TaxID=578113 RepID=A0A194UY96_CYTMA|nr:hypothetical protein VP1G_03968 [Valsa mali var. pyri (nom. inval.)]